MRRRLLSFFVVFFMLSALYGQDLAPPGEVGPVPELDRAVKNLAAGINRALAALEARNAALGSWTYRDSIPPLSSYWAAQLTEELTNIPGRTFILLSGGQGNAEVTISGEIVEVAGIIRIYTRLLRSSDRAISSGFHSDFERGESLIELLAGGGSGGGDGRSSSIARDAYESDSQENPLVVEIADDDNGSLVNRTLHTGNDEDFFLLVPDKDGVLVMETSGNIDTYMEFYEAGSQESLTHDDDGGSGNNARIRYPIRAGGSYIAKVRGYDGSMGSYNFRAWLVEQVRQIPDEYESDDDFASAKETGIGTPQQHTFTTGDDVDWVKFQISDAGRYTIRARGVTSTRLDTYVELFDANRGPIGENDDGGENLDALLSVNLEAGVYYLKVECLDDEPDQPYTISVAVE